MKTRSLNSPARVRSGRVALAPTTKRWLMIALLVALLLGLVCGGAGSTVAAADVADRLPAVVSVGERDGGPAQAARVEAMLREIDATLQSARTQGAGRTRAGGRAAFAGCTGAMPWTPAGLLR